MRTSMWLGLLGIALTAGCTRTQIVYVEDTSSSGGDPTGPTDPTNTQTDDAAIDAAWATLPTLIPGLPNVDDDNGDGDVDWEDEGHSSENDYASLVIPADIADNLQGATLVMTLSGDTGGIRVWYDGSIVIGGGDTETSIGGADFDVEFQVEFDYFLTEGVLNVAQVTDDGEVLREHDIVLQASPLILNHHLQPSEHTWAMDISLWGGNGQMIDEYESSLGEDFSSLHEGTYGYDVWVQDEIEFATATAEGQRLDIVVDSIRDRGLDNFPEYELEGPDFAVMTWGSGWATSQDSFGNLEATPPHDAGGVEYPFGRIYWGGSGSYVPTRDLTDFLEDQKVQEPIVIDTTWLCVGHVDEFMTFIPDPAAPRGFRLVMNDVGEFYNDIEQMPASTSLPLYQSGHGYATIGDIANDASLRFLNEDIQADDVDPITQTFIDEMELTDDEIIYFPGAYEEVWGCGTWVAALVPGTLNLIVGNRESDTKTHLFMADPHFRTNDGILDDDLFIPTFLDRLPKSVEAHWMDDWDVYHLGLGEVHCGTNVTRTPTVDWWTEGLHLLE